MTSIPRIVLRRVGITASGSLLFVAAAMADVRSLEGRSSAVPESVAQPLPVDTAAAAVLGPDPLIHGHRSCG